MGDKLKSYSQAGQDLWVLEQIGPKGTFLDIGCGTKDFYSNTWLLEQKGWTGWLVDNRPEVVDSTRTGGNYVIHDATKLSYGFLEPDIDYLSLDVDDATLDVLRVLPLSTTRFKCITIEHDYYRLGNILRQGEREILLGYGYILDKEDVEHNGLAYEDWWTYK